jgi:hypothetical protein
MGPSNDVVPECGGLDGTLESIHLVFRPMQLFVPLRLGARLFSMAIVSFYQLERLTP